MDGESFVISLQSEIQRATKDLENVDESLRRLSGRDFNEQRNERRPRVNSFNQSENFEIPVARKPAGSVLSRLGSKVTGNIGGERKVQEDFEERGNSNHIKPSLASSIVARPQSDGKTRTEIVAALNKDKHSAERNRRMFGSLLGTLQRFRKDEAKHQFKDDRRAKVIQRVEEKSQAEREKLLKEKNDLLGERRDKQAMIRRLNRKMEDLKRYEAYENYRRSLGRFIRTKALPQIFWMPKLSHSRSTQMVNQTKEAIENEIQDKRKELNDELNDILGKKKGVSNDQGSNKRPKGANNEEQDEEEEREGLQDTRSKFSEEDSDQDNFNQSVVKNGSDHLNYEDDEGELLYEDALMLPGKTSKTIDKGKKMVVQVNRDSHEFSRRRVELVNVDKLGGANKRVREASDSEESSGVVEKSSVQKRKVTVTYRNGIENDSKRGNITAASSEKKKRKRSEKEKKKKGDEKRREKVIQSPVTSRAKKDNSKKKPTAESRSDSSGSESEAEIQRETQEKSPLPTSDNDSEIENGYSHRKNKMKSNTSENLYKSAGEMTEQNVHHQRSNSHHLSAETQSPSASPRNLPDSENQGEEASETLITHAQDDGGDDSSNDSAPNAQGSNLTELVIQRVPLSSLDDNQLNREIKNNDLELQAVIIDTVKIKKEERDKGYDVHSKIIPSQVKIKKEKDASPIRPSKPDLSKSSGSLPNIALKSKAEPRKSSHRPSTKAGKKNSNNNKDSSDSEDSNRKIDSSSGSSTESSSSESDEEREAQSKNKNRKEKTKSKSKTRVIRKKRRDTSSSSSEGSTRRRKSSGGSSESGESSSSSDDERKKKKKKQGDRKKSPQSSRKSSDHRGRREREKERDRKGRARESKGRQKSSRDERNRKSKR